MPRLRRKISDLDPIDKRIIEILQVNAKTPYREMAKKLGLSISTVHERVK
ncbi:MAG: AsnC family transcriptional regulator, partial [Thermoprotei archaeon]